MDLLAGFVAENGKLPADLAEPAKTLRNAAEDIRGWYAAALTAQPGAKPTLAALADWFWAETGAGALLLAAHPICLHHEDPQIQRVGKTLWLPRSQKHLLPRTE